MRELLLWIEATSLGHLMRESGPWTYAIVNLTHILAVSTLFGSVLMLDLRLLGVWSRRVRIADLASAVTPVAMTGFLIAIATGSAMLATKATAYADNPFLLIKFPAIALGVINAAVLNRMPAWRERHVRAPTPRERRQLALFGGISLTAWLTAVTCGRMIGYW
jgi:zinc transporter ZupT